jgi:hypothetical protein
MITEISGEKWLAGRFFKKFTGVNIETELASLASLT